MLLKSLKIPIDVTKHETLEGKNSKKTCNMGLEKLPTLEIHFYFMLIEFYNTAVEI